jgi:hypothetical protein
MIIIDSKVKQFRFLRLKYSDEWLVQPGNIDVEGSDLIPIDSALSGSQGVTPSQS